MTSKEMRKRDKKATAEAISGVQNEYQIQFEKPGKPVNTVDFAKRILGASHVSLIGGPFHYSIRSGTYGDPYDEIPWKVRMGMSQDKGRQGFGDNPQVCTYEPRVLLNNWVEERRDKTYIKYDRSRLSQYGHYYVSEYMKSYQKPLCNKAKDVLLNISTFPLPSFPAHQPELDVETLRMSVAKPEECVVDETIAQCQKEMDREKRYYKASQS